MGNPPTSLSVERVRTRPASNPNQTHQLHVASPPNHSIPPGCSTPGFQAAALQAFRLQHSRLQNSLFRGTQSGGTGHHRPPQAATGRQTFWPSPSLPGAPWGSLGLPGAPWGSLGPPSLKPPWGSLGLLGTPLPQTPTSCHRLPKLLLTQPAKPSATEPPFLQPSLQASIPPFLHSSSSERSAAEAAACKSAALCLSIALTACRAQLFFLLLLNYIVNVK